MSGLPANFFLFFVHNCCYKIEIYARLWKPLRYSTLVHILTHLIVGLCNDKVLSGDVFTAGTRVLQRDRWYALRIDI